jgi:tRNA threonylcarbamoyl adenosine modification protein (Sua5/YciO/YrdC/YwlC family)
LVVRAQPDLPMDLGDRGPTIAVRVPDHAPLHELLRSTGPLAVSSANINAQPAATTVAEAVAQFGDGVAVYLDGGPASGAAASTIVQVFTDDEVQVLRVGAISVADVEQAVADLDSAPKVIAPTLIDSDSAPADSTRSDPAASPSPDSPGGAG